MKTGRKRMAALVLTTAMLLATAIPVVALQQADSQSAAQEAAGSAPAEQTSAGNGGSRSVQNDSLSADGQEDVIAQAEEQAEESDANGVEYDGYIFKLKDGTILAKSAKDTEGIDKVEYSAGTYTAESLEDLENFVSEDDIEYVEPNYIMYLLDADVAGSSSSSDTGSVAGSAGASDTSGPQAADSSGSSQAQSVTEPNDKYYTAGYQWNLTQMNVQEAWSLGIEGQDMDNLTDMDCDGTADNDKSIIAVIDSGLKVGHEDIDWSHVLTGKNFVNPGNDETNTDDELGHGTFCTGLIMADKDNEVGIAGIAQDVYVMPLKVFQTSSVSTDIIVSAINYAATQRQTFNETNGASGTNISVISMSLGGESTETSLKTATEAAIEAGIIVVCAAGNDGDYTASYPAQYAIGVGSTDSAREVSYYSQRLSQANGTGYENKVWVVAPGEEVTSLYKSSTSSYYTGSGTSFSTPCVSALAALAVSLRNDLTTYCTDCANNHEAFKQLLKDTAVQMDGSSGKINGQDVEYGWGLADFGATLSALSEEMEGDGTVTVNIINEAGTEIPNATLVVTDPTDNSTVSANSDGTYTLRLGRRYTYTATASKYQEKTGIMLTLADKREVTITMTGQTYKTRFSVWNSRGDLISSPEITVSKLGGGTVSQNSDGSFSTGNGKYTYTVSADGYFNETGTFTIDDLTDDTLETSGKNVDVTIHGDIDVCSTKLTVIGADGSDITNDTVSEKYTTRDATVITLLDSEGNEEEIHTDGYYKLAPDVYTYTVENDDYKTVTGSFVISEDDKDTAMERKIYMQDRLYNVYMNVFPLWAARITTVTNGLGETERRDVSEAGNMEIKYRLCNGTYKYKVESAGFKTYTGTFTVNGKTLDVDIDLEEGDGSTVVDDGTSDDQFITIGSSLYSLSALKKYESTASFTIGGSTQTLSGITLSDIVTKFTPNIQNAVTATVATGSSDSAQDYEISADDFDNAMIAWKDGELYLAINGADSLIADPGVITLNYHIHSEKTEVLEEATCTKAGKARYTCVDCGNVREDTLPALGHDYDEDTGICTRCGQAATYDTDTVIYLNGVEITSAQMREHTTYATYTAYDYYGTSESHYVVGILLSDLVEYFLPDSCVNMVQITTLDSAYGTYYRSGSGIGFEDTMIAWLIDGVEPGTYDYDNHLRIAQNGSQTGTWLYSPSEFTASTTDHKYGNATVKAPTCSEEGYTTRECSVCGHVDKYDVKAATGEHVWSAGVVKTAPSCEAQGETIYYCDTCGKSKLESVAATGHSWTTGSDGKVTCSVCGKEINDSIVVVAENPDEKGSTGSGKTVAKVSAPEGGWTLGSENTFVVKAGEPCAVILKNGDSYEKLEATKIADGEYSFTCKIGAESTIFVTPAGDGNGDGVVDLKDIMLAKDEADTQSATAGSTAALTGMALALDLDGDGKVTDAEVNKILSAALQKTTLNW